MKYILDSNVFKRVAGSNRNKNVDKWLATVNDADLYVSSLTLLESQQGITLLRKSADLSKVRTANEIESELNGFLTDLGDRILSIDQLAAREWGRRLTKHGTKKWIDLGIISVVATTPDAVAVTQNLEDFRHRGLTVINPYDDPPSTYSDAET